MLSRDSGHTLKQRSTGNEGLELAEREQEKRISNSHSDVQAGRCLTLGFPMVVRAGAGQPQPALKWPSLWEWLSSLNLLSSATPHLNGTQTKRTPKQQVSLFAQKAVIGCLQCARSRGY